ncbi:MAG: polysaccharide deacetylase family protein [Acidimicrobiia bacterium]|nr:polysaccharide deacetylase family protein [Acidimicrobiia bacterium]
MKQLVQQLSLMADSVASPPAGVTILIYHRVGGGSDSAVDLDVDQFDRQLAHLAEHHRVLTLDAAVAELTAGVAEGWGAANRSDADDSGGAEPAAARAVVITFDDGTPDFTDVVVPALERHQLPATLYVATSFIDEGLDFPWGAPPAEWAPLRESVATGLVTIGSHTHTHGLLDRLDEAALDDDLDRSIDLITEHIGVRPRHFAYPKAVPGSAAAEIAVRRRFETAALARNRVNRPQRTDLHRLWRTPVKRSDTPDLFAARAAGGLRLEGELRALASRVRYRGAER